MDWKIDRDPFYKELLPSIGVLGLIEAGFFEDTSTEDVDLKESVKVLCTPLAFMHEKLLSAKNPCIILTTGSFCPLHTGHIEMMEKVKSHLANIGYDVVGGFISPGHDEYINQKNEDKAIPIHYRIRTIMQMTKHYDWISVDPWEGLFCKVAVNFTDVYLRLQMYVKEHLNKDIPIFFVSGGDNARFAMTFMKRGNCVIVNRPSYEDRFNQYKEKLKDCKNIHFIDGDNPMSSTQLRTAFVPDEKKNLILRIENEEKRKAYWLLMKHFAQVDRRHLHDQKKHFYKKMNLGDMISLDSLLKSVHNFKISRSYDIFGTKMMGYVNRPGTPSFQEQLSEIEKGDYILFDDDIHTGSTMRFAKALIEATGSKVKEVASLNISTPANSEILDCRDFFIGGKNNGLVIRMPDGKDVRAPYVYPYVCPFIRASIGDPMGFSIEIWKMNMEIFQANKHTLSEYPFLQDLYKRIGFKMEDSMYSICKWHHDLLVNLYEIPKS